MTRIEKECNRIAEYGCQIDELSLNSKFEELKKVLDDMIEYKNADDNVSNDVNFNYYLGTGFGIYADYVQQSANDKFDSSVIDLRRKSMFYFRKSLELNNGVSNPDSRLKLCILTNYANQLVIAGRYIEALNVYRNVLEIDNEFSMGMGNYGRTLMFLANMVNDKGHYQELHCYAYHALKKALQNIDYDMHEQALSAFGKLVEEYEALPSVDYVNKPIVFPEYALGDSDEEIQYRKWCLKNHLFLNPLNDVVEIESAFAHDPLNIIKYTEDITASDSINGNPAEPPRWFAMLNNLKEEYIYARYLCFISSEEDANPHFADKDVTLSFGSFDNTVYSIRVEQGKTAFRVLYSLLDKICFFVNDFWRIGLEEGKVTANRICKAKNYPKDNKALMSLYWVLCEFFEKYGDAEHPYEKELAILRNALEHKYVKIHKGDWNRRLKIESDSFYHISENDLRANTIRLLQLVRESLMYLIYAIEKEEIKKSKSKSYVGTMPISNYPDSWKI